MGDPAGIGPELSLLAWRALRTTGPAFVLLGDPAHIAALGPATPTCTVATFAEAAATFRDALPVLPISLATTPTPGHPCAANAPAVIASIEQAVRLAQSGAATAVVTNPISKAVLYGAGWPTTSCASCPSPSTSRCAPRWTC